MAGLKDIVINIKAELDDKEYEKSLKRLTDSSATALEKAYHNLGNSVIKQMGEFNKMVDKNLSSSRTGDKDFGISFNGEWLADLDKFIAKFKEFQGEIRNTGFLPKGMDSNLYRAYDNVNKLYEAYQKAVDEETKLNEKISATPVEKFAEVRQSVVQAALNVNKLETELEKIENEYRILSQLEAMPKIDPAKLKRYETITATIENLRAKSRELYESATSMPKDDEKAIALLKQREEIEQQIVGQERALNTIGKETIANIQHMKELENQLTFERGKVGLDDLAKRADKVAEKLAKAEEKHRELLGEERATTEQYEIDTESYEKAKQHTDELETELAMAAHRVNELNDNANRTGTSFNKLRQYAWSLSRVLGNVYTIGLDIANGAKKIYGFYVKVWNAAKKIVSVIKKLGTAMRGTAEDHAKSFKQMLKDLFRYTLGIRSLFMLFRRLRKYVSEAFEAMAEQIPEVNARLSELKSSFNAMKASFGTALEPALAAFKTQLIQIIDLISKLLTYVGMFIAALTGRGYVYQAKKVATSFADAAGSAKELNKQLQKFDELNNLTTSNDSGGGADSPLAQFEKVDIPDWIKNLAERVKKLWEDIMGPIRDAWAKVGDYVVNAWKRAFKNIGLLLNDIVNDFVKAWKSGLGEAIATSFFKIIGDIGEIVANIAQKIRDAWNFVEEGQTESNGLRFWKAVLGIIDKILAGIQRITEGIKEWTAGINITPAMTAFVHWLESLVPIAEMVMDILFNLWDKAFKPILTWAFDGENSGVARFFQMLADFNNGLDKEKIVNDLNKIWEALGRFGINIGEGLLKFMERMLGYLQNWLNSDEFTAWCQKVSDFLDGLDPEELADDLEQVWRIIKNIAEWVWKGIKLVIDNKDKILDALEKISEHLDMVAAIIIGGKLAIDFSRLLINLYLAKDAFAAIASFLGGKLLPILVYVFENIGSIAVSIGGKLVGGLQTGLQGLMSLAGTELPAVGATLGTTLASALIAAFVGAQIGQHLVGPWLHPEDKELYENFRWFEGEDSFFHTIFNEDPEILKSAWKEMWGDMTADVKEAGITMGEIIVEKTHDIGAKFSELGDKIKAKKDDIKTSIGDMKTNTSENFENIKTKVSEFAAKWGEKFTDAKTKLADFGANAKTKLNELKDAFIKCFEGIKNGIKAPINAVLGFVEKLVNGIVDAINGVGDKLGSMKFDVPEWVPGIGGKKFNMSMPKLNHVSIPKLAQGAVIPPNNEFLAVLGDQKKGTNIESPLSTMVEAFNQANKGGNEQEIALLQEQNDLLRQLLQKEFGISENAIFNSVRNQDKVWRKSTGSSAFAY